MADMKKVATRDSYGNALKELGVMRLASRISDLKKQGYPIKSETVSVKNRFEEDCYIKRYSLQGGEA